MPLGRTPLQSATASGVPALAPNTGLGHEAQVIAGLTEETCNFFCAARFGGEAVQELSDSEVLARLARPGSIRDEVVHELSDAEGLVGSGPFASAAGATAWSSIAFSSAFQSWCRFLRTQLGLRRPLATQADFMGLHGGSGVLCISNGTLTS